MLAVFIMTIFISIVWYLIGSIGGLWLSRKVYPKTTNGDLVFLFTMGGRTTHFFNRINLSAKRKMVE